MKLHKINRVITSTAISVVVGLLLLFVLGRAAYASPTAFTVNTVLDQIDDNTGDGICHTAAGFCSLRAAVMEANNGSGATIVVPAGTYTLTLTGNGDLEMRQDITLNGAGANLTIIQGNPAGWSDRILRIRNNANATVNGVTIRYGHAADFGGGIYVVTGTLTLKNSVIVSNTAGQGGGGGIYNGDQLTVTLSTIMSNSVVGPFGYFGGGVYNAAGGYAYLTRTLIQGNVSPGSSGFYNDSGAQAHLNFSTVSSNHAITAGGAVWNNGIADLVWVTVTNNLAAADAGGIYNGMGANAIIVDPFIAYNTAPSGGGVYNDMTGTLILAGGSVSSNTAMAGPGGGVYNNSNAKLTILAVDISHNQAQGLSGDGGGVFGYGPLVIADSNLSSNSGHYGGGIFSDGGLTLTLSTLANNSALQGGGLDLESGGGSIDQSIFSGNTAASGGGVSVSGVFTDQVTIDNSTLSGNIADSTDGQSPDCAGELRSVDHNLIQNTLGCTITGTVTHNITGTNALLGPLQNNGGPTWTRALLPGSPAIDAGAPHSGSFDCATTDQRGVARPIGPYCDIGAYEAPPTLQVFVPLVRR